MSRKLYRKRRIAHYLLQLEPIYFWTKCKHVVDENIPFNTYGLLYYRHRFNRAQQDLLLPHVEQGTITLIGATTENPSFSVNSALLSRCRVFVLKSLEMEHVMSLLRKAVDVKTKDLEELGKILKIEESILNRLAVLCDGDGREIKYA